MHIARELSNDTPSLSIFKPLSLNTRVFAVKGTPHIPEAPREAPRWSLRQLLLPNSRERKKPLPLPAPIPPLSPHPTLAVAALVAPPRGLNKQMQYIVKLTKYIQTYT
jgi:hypothetical protein